MRAAPDPDALLFHHALSRVCPLRAQMVIVKDGAATRLRGEAQDEVQEAEEEAEPERFSSLEKKIRALEKRRKSIGELKQRMRRGFEMDAQQQARALHAVARSANPDPTALPSMMR